jgi:hypothetical protein
LDCRGETIAQAGQQVVGRTEAKLVQQDPDKTIERLNPQGAGRFPALAKFRPTALSRSLKARDLFQLGRKPGLELEVAKLAWQEMKRHVAANGV